MKDLSGYKNVKYTDDIEEVSELEFDFDKECRYGVKCTNIMAADTETSNAVAFNNTAIGYNQWKYDNCPNYRKIIDEGVPVSTMYMWQWGIDQTDYIVVFYGRDLISLNKFMMRLSEELQFQNKCGKSTADRKRTLERMKDFKTQIFVRCYYHNFSFDFAELSNLYHDDFGIISKNGRARTFAREMRRPMKTFCEEGNVRFSFYDSYSLTQKSLKNWGEDDKLPVQKIVKSEEYYYELRTPLTTLTEEEVEYAIVDIVTMVYGLRNYVKRFGSIHDIPLTATSITEHDALKALTKDPEWGELQAKIQKSYTYEFFLKLLKLYTGGWTHANADYVNKIISSVHPNADIKGTVICHDFASSYPYCLCAGDHYPISAWKKLNPDEFERIKDNPLTHTPTVWFGKFRFTKVRSKLRNNFFSESKCTDLDELKCIIDNGRVKYADYMECYLSDYDYDIFKRSYNFNSIECVELYEAQAGRLSKELVKFILEGYGAKTSCKNSNPSIYQASKQRVNSIYGLACRKIVSKIISYYEGKWHSDGEDDSMNNLFKKTIKRTKPETIVNSYAIGIYCCKMAMYNLWNFIIAFDEKTIYCDTDSLKGLLTEDDIKLIDEYNKHVEEIENEAADELGLPRSMFAPKTDTGEVKRLGVFEREHGEGCHTFATLGAKRYYCEYTTKNKKTNVKYNTHEVTVAGLPKKAGYKKIRTVEQFLDPEYTKFTNAESMKKIAYYNDEQPEIKWLDREGNHYTSTEKYTCTILPTSFNLGVSSSFERFLCALENGTLPDPTNDNPDAVIFAELNPQKYKKWNFK